MVRITLAALVATASLVACTTDPPGSSLAICKFPAGSPARETLTNPPAVVPIKHVIVVVNENRSFDHLFGSLVFERGGVDGIPSEFTNLDLAGQPVSFTHRTDTCFPKDAPHDEEHLDSAVNGGAMDGFVKAAATSTNNGHYVMSYYTRAELPFYYFLADKGLDLNNVISSVG